MEIKILSYTPNLEQTLWIAAKTCTTTQIPDMTSIDKENEENRNVFLQQIFNSGHLSVFEHASFTFAIEGVSRITSHQLVRHRLASFSQRSQRYTTSNGISCVTPPSIQGNPQAKEKFEHALRNVFETYQSLLDAGIPKEDARYILPHGWTTGLIVTMNVRELFHFLQLRLCTKAQWEIRDMAEHMLQEVRHVSPFLASLAGPPCISEGVCREKKPCKNYIQGMSEFYQKKGVRDNPVYSYPYDL